MQDSRKAYEVGMMKKHLILTWIIFFLFTGILVFGAEQDEAVSISITSIKNESGNEQLDLLCDTVTDTVEFNLRLIGNYEVKKNDFVDPVTDFEAAKKFYRSYGFDNAIFGKMSTTNEGNYVLTMSVWNREDNRITVEKQTEFERLLEIFEITDTLVATFLESFSGTKVAFGELIITNEGDRIPYNVYIDNNFAGENLSKISVLVGERSVKIMQKKERGETIIKSERLIVREGEQHEIVFEVERGEAPEPQTRGGAPEDNMFYIATDVGKYYDVVTLKNGTTRKGVIIEQIPGESLRIKTRDGSIFVIGVDEIEKLEAEKREDAGPVTEYSMLHLQDGSTIEGTIIGQIPGKTVMFETKEGEVVVPKWHEIDKLVLPAEKGKAEKADAVSDEDALYTLNRKFEPNMSLSSLQNVNILDTTLQKVTEYDRLRIFNNYKKDNAGLAFALNFFLPFGIGSYVQGNIGMGVYRTVSEVVFSTTLIVSAVTMDYSTYQVFTPLEYVLIGVTGLNQTVSAIASWISPFTFEDRYNRLLRSKLNVH